jgi:hypothetical protein
MKPPNYWCIALDSIFYIAKTNNFDKNIEHENY